MPQICSYQEYETLKNQQPLFSDLVNKIDPRWVYKSLRFKSFLEQCQKRNIQPVREGHYNQMFADILANNKDFSKLKPLVQEARVNEIILMKLRDEVLV